jgi:hypothetical protein
MTTDKIGYVRSLGRPLALALLVTLSSPLLLVAVSQFRPAAWILAAVLLTVAVVDWLRP